MNKLLLVGAGHAHLYVLKKLKEEAFADTEVTVLAISEHEYHSEMIAGYIEEQYSLENIRIDAANLAAEAGADWIEGAAVSVDPEQKVVLTEQGKVIGYDVVSFDIGSLTYGTETPGVLEHALLMKPNHRMPEVSEALKEALRPVIVGSGATAAEWAFGLQARRKREGKEPLVLVSNGGLLEQEGPKMSEKAERIARNDGMALHLHDGVEAVAKNKIVTAANRKISFDRLLWAEGKRPHQMFASSLPTDASGYLLVEDTLQVKKYPSVFGAGECVTVNGAEYIEKSLFTTVRQARVLWENLKGFLGNGQGEYYKPKPSPLKIISAGDRRALLRYKSHVFAGKWPWRMKNRLQKGYLKSFRE